MTDAEALTAAADQISRQLTQLDRRLTAIFEQLEHLTAVTLASTAILGSDGINETIRWLRDQLPEAWIVELTHQVEPP